MIDAIEPVSASDYGRTMRSVALRLLTFLAILMMPLGMQPAPAAMHDQHSSAAMRMEHCPDGQSQSDRSAALHSCMMACSASLPAADLPAMAAPLALGGLVEASFVRALAGIELEIATPPPRLS